MCIRDSQQVGHNKSDDDNTDKDGVIEQVGYKSDDIWDIIRHRQMGHILQVSQRQTEHALPVFHGQMEYILPVSDRKMGHTLRMSHR